MRMKDRLSGIGFLPDGFESADPEQISRKYLSECGMREEEINRLKAVLEGKQPQRQ